MKFQGIFNRLIKKNFTLQFVFSMLVNQIENLITAHDQVSFSTLFLCLFVFCCCFFPTELYISFSFVFNLEESS